jgi:hypothetical protein
MTAIRTELISIPTDTVPLDGVMYTPAARSVTGAVLYFHGNTMNFYVGGRIPGRCRRAVRGQHHR